MMSSYLHAVFKEVLLNYLWVDIDTSLVVLMKLCSIPEKELDNLLVRIVLSVVKGGVAIKVESVDDGLHGVLH